MAFSYYHQNDEKHDVNAQKHDVNAH